MKPIYAFTLYFVLLASCLFSQIPNAGFETWTHPSYGNEPTGWATLNIAAQFGCASLSTFTTTDAHSGTYACRIRTVKYGAPCPSLPGFQDTIGICGVGSLDVFAQKVNYGFTYSLVPTHLDFYAKYTPSGTDTAWVVTWLQKRTGSVVDTIAYAAWPMFTTTSAYVQQHVPLVYTTFGVNPDTAVIAVSSSGPIKPQVGSELYVDDFAFTGSVAGIQNLSSNAANILVFPNPVTDVVTIEISGMKAKEISIYTATGQLAGIYTVSNNKVVIDTKKYAKGIYTYNIKGETNTLLKAGKFTVEK